MKKCLAAVFAVAACLQFNAAYAAAGDAGFSHIGIKAGAGIAGTEYSPLSSGIKHEGTGGFGGGVFARYRLNDKFSVQPEVLYALKGFNQKATAPLASTEVDYRMNYLDIPLFVRFSPGGESGRFRIFAGPLFSFLMSARASTKISVGPASVTSETDIKDSFKSNDLGAAGGIGFDFASGLSIDLQVSKGLKDVSAVNGVKIKNNSGMLMLG
ncbi:MAG: porin family protein, partial [bacterium]